MKITRVRTRVVSMPLAGPFHPAWARGRAQEDVLFTLVEIGTDDGIVGVTAAHAGLEAAVSIQRFVAPHLIGRDPRHVEAFAQILSDAEILGPPLYCIEAAIWDILGKLAGLPVAMMWGLHDSRIPVYCATAEVRPAEVRIDDVLRLRDEGYRAVKLRFHSDDPRDDVKVAAAVRSAVGDEFVLIIDANQAGVEPGLSGHRTWGFRTALQVARELRDLSVAWLEEPLPRHDYAALRRLRDHVPELPLAGGEDNHGLHEFRTLVERGCYDILQPDAVLSEGVGQLRKVAALAEAAGIKVTPHTWSNGIGLLTNLHFALSIPNGTYFEFPNEPGSGFTIEARDQMLTEPTRIDSDGFLCLPERPGFGIELDEARIARYTVNEL
jgi:D-galactarolactone cycloisomerase